MSGARSDTWMPWYIGDYLADTMHLTRDQHGGYLLLIAAYWRRGAPLLDDDGHLAGITKASAAEWRRLRPVLAEFFDVVDGLWKHKRIDEERQRAATNTEKRAKAGAKGADNRWHGASQNDGNPIAKLLAKASQIDGTLPSPSPVKKETMAQAPESGIVAPLPEPVPQPGLTMAEQGAAIVAGDTELSLQKAIIAKFDEVGHAVFTKAAFRHYPHQRDLTTARRWIEHGADLDLCEAVFDAACRRMLEARKQPPASLAFFDQDISNAIAAAKKPMPEPQTVPQGTSRYQSGSSAPAPNAQRSMWLSRVLNFKNSGFWLPQWGEPPSDPSNLIPVDVLLEVYGENWREILRGPSSGQGEAA